MLYQPNAPERATFHNKDALLTNWHSHWKHSKSIGFTQNNVGIIVEIIVYLFPTRRAVCS